MYGDKHADLGDTGNQCTGKSDTSAFRLNSDISEKWVKKLWFFVLTRGVKSGVTITGGGEVIAGSLGSQSIVDKRFCRRTRGGV